MGNFERKHYTNPTLMFESLDRIGVKWSRTKEPLPAYGLLRIQWEGPWTKPSIQTRARYRHTHWIGFYNVPDGSTFGRSGVFDVNGLNNGSGWMLYRDWATILVPHILKTCEPLADGGWHITHAIEVEKPHRIATRTVLSFPGDPDIELTC
jgi:hypothetical protein